MTWFWRFSHQPSYHRYLNEDAATGLKERLDDLMPPLQYNEDGELLLVPGEVFCRWRNCDGSLCKRRKAFADHLTLRKHYEGRHRSRAVTRPQGSFTKEYNLRIQIWYNALVNGDKPFWVPPEEDDIVDIVLDFDFASVEEENDYDWMVKKVGCGQGST